MSTKINDDLGKLYYDRKEGLKSAYKLYKQAKDNDIDVKINDVKLFLNSQPLNQIITSQRNKHYIPIIGKPNNYQCDLMFMDDYKGFNKGIIGLFNFVDTISRKGYSYPIKDKTQKTIIEIMKKFISRNTVEVLFTDKGSEFIAKTFKKLLVDNNIEHIIAQKADHNKMSLIERYNKSIRSLINNYMIAYNTNKYIDALDDLVYNYNNTVNETTKYKPDDVKDDEKVEIVVNRYKKAYPNILKFKEHKIGDKVRLLEPKAIFDKGGVMWSRELYTITGIDGFTFKVSDQNGKEKRKKFKHYEVKLVSELEEKSNKYLSNQIPKQFQEEKNKKLLKKNLRKEGIDVSNILRGKRKTSSV